MYRVRDFIETRDGLLFSVLSNVHPQSGIIAHLRFKRTPGGFAKFQSSEDSYRYLNISAPDYVQFIEELDREVTIVPRDRITRHLRPGNRLSDMVEAGEDPEVSAIVMALLSRSDVSLDEFGITGSHLVGAHTEASDIDLVVYGLENYHRVIRSLLEGVDDGIFQLPDQGDWERIYEKRKVDPVTYSLPEFIWHESRKFNRAKFRTRRFDILSCRRVEEVTGDFGDFSYKRLGKIKAECVVQDDSLAFDYPARYIVSNCKAKGHPVTEIVSFTHTFVDQVRKGERAVCQGFLEKVMGKDKYYRILVGTSREAEGEFIKVKGA